MKKTAISILRSGLGVVLLLAVFSAPLSAEFQKPRLYIKLNGAGSLADGGDFGDFVDRNEIYYAAVDAAPGYNAGVTAPSYFLGFGGEIGLETSKYAVGISAGYLEKNFHLDYLYQEPGSGFEDRYVRDYTFSAVPIFLLFHYKVIDTSFFMASVTVGQGVYLGRYRDERRQTFKEHDLTFVNSVVESKKNRLGFHLGAAFQFNVTRNLAFFIDAAYRLVNFEDMEAVDYYEDDNVTGSSNEGEFYYWANRRTGESRFGIGENDGFFWDSTPAAFNINGFSLTVGIKITFGSGKKVEPVKFAPMD
jgi:opacity protein-like surface antigen